MLGGERQSAKLKVCFECSFKVERRENGVIGCVGQ